MALFTKMGKLKGEIPAPSSLSFSNTCLFGFWFVGFLFLFFGREDMTSLVLGKWSGPVGSRK